MSVETVYIVRCDYCRVVAAANPDSHTEFGAVKAARDAGWYVAPNYLEAVCAICKGD